MALAEQDLALLQRLMGTSTFPASLVSVLERKQKLYHSIGQTGPLPASAVIDAVVAQNLDEEPMGDEPPPQEIDPDDTVEVVDGGEMKTGVYVGQHAQKKGCVKILIDGETKPRVFEKVNVTRTE